MDRDLLKALRDEILTDQGWRCACCGRVCGLAQGDPSYLATIDGEPAVVCHGCWTDPRRCDAALLRRASDG